ncbi:MAG: hypothetical protein HN356_15010 [Calditrichaeota bacterium]|nr:hypothetical protein [Calditrichota bacterium]
MKPIKYLIEQTYSRGLENLVAGQTSIAMLDGERGNLLYRGYDIEELADLSTFDEVSYLLIHGELPTTSQFQGWVNELDTWNEPPVDAINVLDSLPTDTPPLMLYRTMASIAACNIPEGENVRMDAQWRRPARILGWSSTLAAAAICHVLGRRPNPFNPEQSFAVNFLTRSLGRKPTQFEAEAFDVSLIVQAEHGFNVAALAALTVISTGADLGSAVLAGLSALAGKLHGGTNQLAFQNIMQHESAKDARAWVKRKLKDGYRFPGFGHRIYQTHDPRARILEPLARKLVEDRGDGHIWEIYETIRDEVESNLGDKGIFINVGGVSGLIYHALGFPMSSYPIPMALAIQTGLMAHCLEYLSEGNMIEPGAIYTG